MPDRRTFRHQFPIASRIIESAPVVFAALTLCAVLVGAVFGVEFGYGLGLMGLGLLGIWLDRRHLDNWLLTPITWFAHVPALSAGLGVILYAGSGTAISPGFARLQLAHLLGYSAFYLAYGLFSGRKTVIPDFRRRFHADPGFESTMVVVGTACVLWAVVLTLVGIVSGTSDRGEGRQEELLGVWTIFFAFKRLGSVGFFLLPLVLARGSLFTKAIVGCSGFIVIAFGFLSGSRQEAFLPLIAIIAGYYTFCRPRFLRLEHLLILLLPFGAAAFVFLQFYRNTDAYQAGVMSDPLSKIRAVGEAVVEQEDSADSDSMLLGQRLVGTVDTLVFELTPELIPYAGFDRAEAILWVYVPYYFYRDKPVMQDGIAIAEEYLNRRLIGTSISVSLVGDSYRRFGWIGVPILMLLNGVLWGWLAKVSVANANTHRGYAGMVGLMMIASFALKDANMTNLTFLWYALYDLPKQGFALWILFRAVDVFFGMKGRRLMTPTGRLA